MPSTDSVKCRRCDGDGQVEEPVTAYRDGQTHWSIAIVPCPAGCTASIGAEERIATAERERQAHWAKKRVEDFASLLPRHFSNLTLGSHPNQTFAAEVNGWRPTSEKWGLFLYGNFGSGKTGLALGLAKELIGVIPGAYAAFSPVPELLETIRDGYNADSTRRGEKDPLQSVLNVEILVIDDLGAERPTEWVQEKLYYLINHRHAHELTTIFTSNLSLKELAGRLGERTVWRIAEMCKVVKVEGENLRERKLPK